MDIDRENEQIAIFHIDLLCSCFEQCEKDYEKFRVIRNIQKNFTYLSTRLRKRFTGQWVPMNDTIFSNREKRAIAVSEVFHDVVPHEYHSHIFKTFNRS